MAKRVLRGGDAWSVVADHPGERDRRFCETVFTLGNGYMASRGTCPELGRAELNRPATLIAGLFEKPLTTHKPPRLVICPDWLGFTYSDGDGELSRGEGTILSYQLRLNLRDGTLNRSFRWRGPGGKITHFTINRLVSLAEPHLCAERFYITPENYGGGVVFSNLLDAGVRPHDKELQYSVVENRTLDAEGVPGGLALEVETVQSRSRVAAASVIRAGRGRARARLGEEASQSTLPCVVAEWQTLIIDRIAAFASSADPTAPGEDSDPVKRAVQTVRQADSWDRIARRHRQTWRDYWDTADIEIEGDPEIQWQVRFVLFHLWQCACSNSTEVDASIGARGIHGEGYNGHAFWDTETFMLPYFIMNHPEVARSLLMYRYRRLPAARQRARTDDGISGARFPWESADSGEETTPRALPPDANGRVVRVLTGDQEIHITADVAHAVWSYWENTADEDFYLQHGAELILDTARFWAGRLEKRNGGPERSPGYGISGVIGPDEYHESVADNLYTNAMARWNLRRALTVAGDLQERHPETWTRLSRQLRIKESTLKSWKEKAESIVIPFDNHRRLYPQFDGFFNLRDGRDRCSYRARWLIEEAQQVQIIKQPDVLLALHLLPELADDESFRRHFDYYDARTTHESSLSPSLHALFAARANRPRIALEYLRLALALDTENQGGGSDAGIHAANLGGIWKALIMGFAGLTTSEEGLSLDPRLPRSWKSIRFSIRWRSRLVRFQVTPTRVTAHLAEGAAPITLRLGRRAHQIAPGAEQSCAI